MVQLFRRKETEEEKRVRSEAQNVTAAETERLRLEKIRSDEAYKVEKAAADQEAAASRLRKHDEKVREVREAEAVKKAEARGREEAATAGMAPGVRFIRKAANVAGRLGGGGPTPAKTVRTEETVGGKKIVTEVHYAPRAGGGGRRVIPAFEMGGNFTRRAPARAAPKTRTILVDKGGGVYEEREVPVPGAAAQPARPRAPAGYTFPGLEGNAGLGNVGTSPALRVAAPAKPKKKGATGIPFLDNGW